MPNKFPNRMRKCKKNNNQDTTLTSNLLSSSIYQTYKTQDKINNNVEQRNMQNSEFINEIPVNTSDKKYKIQFFKKSQHEKEQKALVNWNLTEGLKKTDIWDVIIQDKYHLLDKFFKFEKNFQSNRLHAFYNNEKQEGMLMIGKKAMGGMMEIRKVKYIKVFVLEKEDSDNLNEDESKIEKDFYPNPKLILYNPSSSDDDEFENLSITSAIEDIYKTIPEKIWDTAKETAPIVLNT